jgi:hypothetical protein
VVVLPGTYEIGNDNIELSNAIDLHGAPGAPRPVIVSVAANGTTLDGSAAARIADLALTSTDDNPIFGALGSGGGTTVVERVVATSENAPGCNGAPLVPGLMRDTVCLAEGASAAGIDISAGTGAFSFELRNVTAFGAIGLRATVGNGAMTVNARNVIARGETDVAATTVTGGAVTVNLSNSNYLTQAPSGPGSETITDPATNENQTEFPLLAEGSFRQLPGSPTINAGGDFPLLGSLDFDRQPRTQGAAIDIGADEFDDELRLKLKARKRQEARKLKVKVRCPEEECTVFAKGKALVAGERFKLRKTRKRFLDAGEGTRLRLKAKNSSELTELLTQSDGTAKVAVKGSDPGGVRARKKVSVELVG